MKLGFYLTSYLYISSTTRTYQIIFSAWAIHIKSFIDFQTNFKQRFNTCEKEKKIDYHAFNVNLFLPSTYL